MRIKDNPYYPLLTWLIITGLVIFGLVVAYNEEFIAALFYGDRSRISLLIALLYFIGTIHCTSRVLLLSDELNNMMKIEQTLADYTGERSVKLEGGQIVLGNNIRLPSCAAANYAAEVLSIGNGNSQADTRAEQSNLAEVFASSLKSPHEYGWYAVDILLKLGLVGTIIGFIFMLGSIADTASLDVNTMQKVLKQMSAGMGTALFTTLAGLLGSILLGLQYLLLDKSADDLLERSIRLSEVTLKPFSDAQVSS